MQKVLIVGDLHISDKYSGRHVDYWQDCVAFLERVTDEIKKNNITHLILTGDLIGRTTEKNFQNRDSLFYFTKVIQIWNSLTNNNVYTIRGNHDIGEKLTDFDFLVGIGVLKIVPQLDVGGIRFHMMDYGDHARAIEVNPDKYNVSVMHTELHIRGEDQGFFKSEEGVELSSLENLYGVDLAIAGHIHNPSTKLMQTSIKDKDIALYYPGCGTRPKADRNIWSNVALVMLESDANGDVDLAQIDIKLKDAKEVFKDTYEDVKEEEAEDISEAPTIDIESLSEILSELSNYNVLGEDDYKSQIKRLGGIDEKAVELALQYVEEIEYQIDSKGK